MQNSKISEHLRFGTKAEVLERLYSRLTQASVLPQLRFSVKKWQEKPIFFQKKIDENGWANIPLAVRSSSKQEDQSGSSLAGHYCSFLDVQGWKSIEKAVQDVIASYSNANKEDEVFIQPMLTDILLSGVAFTKDPSTSSPYYVINYDDVSGKTDSVTSGSTNLLKTLIFYKYSPEFPPKPFSRIISLLQELETLFASDSIDIEFVITKAGDLFLLQARPLICKHRFPFSKEAFSQTLKTIQNKIIEANRSHPYLYGEKTLFGVMPDWNPAEIIGVRPKPLALSLYKQIVTDQIWAYQRDNYGYHNLRSFPLLVHFFGQPYIDVRVSFNSFIPKELGHVLSDKLVNFYLERLKKEPNLHDKVEFEIIFSCYTLDLPERLAVLYHHGFSQTECNLIQESLRTLTNRIIDIEEGLWKRDIEKIDQLKERFSLIFDSDLDEISKIFWLLEDCKRYGTLPFAGLARAGFIAIQLLQSLVRVGILTWEEYHTFLSSLHTVSSEMSLERAKLSKREFLEKYGHLRPGTYDLLSPRYDEDADSYFQWDEQPSSKEKKTTFKLSLKQMQTVEQFLKKHGLKHNVVSFFEFIIKAIEGREYAKFVFTKHLSWSLKLFGEWGEKQGFSLEECSYADISLISTMHAAAIEPKELLSQSIANGRKAYQFTQHILLPPLITHQKDVLYFTQFSAEPNFITLHSVSGDVILLQNAEQRHLKQGIVFLPSADPGYDWIFSHDLLGFVTMYGGVNSHMAIRAAELDIPAVIGAGELYYKEWSSAQKIELDCPNKLVKILKK